VLPRPLPAVCVRPYYHLVVVPKREGRHPCSLCCGACQEVVRRASLPCQQMSSPSVAPQQNARLPAKTQAPSLACLCSAAQQRSKHPALPAFASSAGRESSVEQCMKIAETCLTMPERASLQLSVMKLSVSITHPMSYFSSSSRVFCHSITHPFCGGRLRPSRVPIMPPHSTLTCPSPPHICAERALPATDLEG